MARAEKRLRVDWVKCDGYGRRCRRPGPSPYGPDGRSRPGATRATIVAGIPGPLLRGPHEG